MKIYMVKLSWFNWEIEKDEREEEDYFFVKAEDALSFCSGLARNEAAYGRYNRPREAYLYSFEEGEAVTEDRRYDAAWHELNRSVRW